jgi:hypothetical protein
MDAFQGLADDEKIELIHAGEIPSYYRLPPGHDKRPATVGELWDVLGELLDDYHAQDIVGQITVRDSQGNHYAVYVEAVLEPLDADNLAARLDTGDDDEPDLTCPDCDGEHGLCPRCHKNALGCDEDGEPWSVCHVCDGEDRQAGG